MFHFSQFLKAATECHYTSTEREHSSILQWNCLGIPVSSAQDSMSNLKYDPSMDIKKILIHSCLKGMGDSCILLALEFHCRVLQLFCIISIIISPREGLKTLDSLIFGWFCFFSFIGFCICKTKMQNTLSEVLPILPFNACGRTLTFYGQKTVSVHFLILLQNLIYNLKESSS